jgi:hypothetical protein
MLQRGGSGGPSDGSPDLASSEEDSPPRSPSGLGTSSGSNPGIAASSIYNDLGDDDWKEDAEVVDHEDHTDVSAGSTPLSALGLEESSSEFPVFQEEEVNPDLQPGGRIQVVEEVGLESKGEQFRDLFTSPPVSEATSLDAMPVKDLRRLAEQRGIANASELRKKEILSALKSQIGGGGAGGSNGPSTVVQLEKTLDLTEVSEILE